MCSDKNKLTLKWCVSTALPVKPPKFQAKVIFSCLNKSIQPGKQSLRVPLQAVSPHLGYYVRF